MNVHKNARLTPQGRALLVRRIEKEGWRVGDAADRWLSAEGGLGSTVITAGDPRQHRGGAIGRCEEGLGQGPFAQARLDEALGLAVGARCIGPGTLVPDRLLGQQIGKAKLL